MICHSAIAHLVSQENVNKTHRRMNPDNKKVDHHFAVTCFADSRESLYDLVRLVQEQNEHPFDTQSGDYVVSDLRSLQTTSGREKLLFCRQRNTAVLVMLTVDDVVHPLTGCLLPLLFGNTDVVVTANRLSDYVMRGYLSKTNCLNAFKDVPCCLSGKWLPSILVRNHFD